MTETCNYHPDKYTSTHRTAPHASPPAATMSSKFNWADEMDEVAPQALPPPRKEKKKRAAPAAPKWDPCWNNIEEALMPKKAPEAPAAAATDGLVSLTDCVEAPACAPAAPVVHDDPKKNEEFMSPYNPKWSLPWRVALDADDEAGFTAHFAAGAPAEHWHDAAYHAAVIGATWALAVLIKHARDVKALCLEAAVCRACEHGHVEFLKAALDCYKQRRLDVSALTGAYTWDPVLQASSNGRLDVLRLLKARMPAADLFRAAKNYNWRAFYKAVDGGHLDVVKWWCEDTPVLAPLKPQARTEVLEKAYKRAVTRSHPAIVAYLAGDAPAPAPLTLAAFVVGDPLRV